MATIIARAPGRVNLIGDHTDYTDGWCLPMAVDRWTEITALPNPAREVVRLASDADDEHAVIALNAPSLPESPRWARYVAAVIDEVRPLIGYVGKVRSTIPIGAGLSSSAALEVACALVLGAPDHDRVALAQLCQRAERAARGTPTGILDQLTVCSGIDDHALLLNCHDLSMTPVPMPPHDEAEIVVVHVSARDLDRSGYSERVQQCEAIESHIGPLREARLDRISELTDPALARRARHVITENERARSAAAALGDRDIVGFGELMNASHASLRDDYESSAPDLDVLQTSMLRRQGVLGARITGGGWGGSMVVLCRPGALSDADDLIGSRAAWRVRAVGGATVVRR